MNPIKGALSLHDATGKQIGKRKNVVWEFKQGKFRNVTAAVWSDMAKHPRPLAIRWYLDNSLVTGTIRVVESTTDNDTVKIAVTLGPWAHE